MEMLIDVGGSASEGHSEEEADEDEPQPHNCLSGKPHPFSIAPIYRASR